VSGHFHLKTSTERGSIRQKKPGKPLENLSKKDVSYLMTIQFFPKKNGFLSKI